MQSNEVISARPRDSQQGIGSGAIFRAAFAGLVVTVLGLVVFRDFVFGDRTLLYKDIGSDSVNVYYPYYVLLSDYVRHTGVPSWSFQIGMGQNLFPYTGMVLLSPVVWLAKGAIAKALIYQHLLYVVIAGALFARFLAGRGLNSASCLLGAILLCFSAYMCMGSCWYSHANEVVCFTFLLFAAEQAVSRGRWIYLPLAVALVGLLSAFHLYLCALFLCFYVPSRLIMQYSWQPRSLVRTSAVLAGIAFLGVGIGAFVSADNLYTLLNSPRGFGSASTATSLFSFPMFGLEISTHYLAAALRPFANDILGTGDNYRGWQNYLEDPISYCGLLCLLIFPQALVKARRRARIFYLLFFAAILIPTVFPWFRYLFWFFQGDYYRVFSLFSILGIITLSMIAFSRYAEDRSLNLWVLLGTFSVLLAILYFSFGGLQGRIDPHLRLVVTIFLVAYAAILVAGKLLQRQKTAAYLVIGIVAIELIYFDRITVAARPTLTKQEFSDRTGYNDMTAEALRDIKASGEGFFRVTKTWGSGPTTRASYNDALIFGYYGTMSYSSFNNLDYIKFLMAVDAISGDEIGTESKWSTGLLWHPLLLTFACEKYVITDDPVPFESTEPYEFVKRYGSIYLFRNRASLPFGVTFNRYLSEDVFLQLPSWAKPQALLHAVVLSDKDAANQPELSQLSLGELKEWLRAASVPDTLVELRKMALDLHSFRDTRIDGAVRLDHKSVMVFQMPFDVGWDAFIDHRTAPVLKVNAGLLGVVLDPGEHVVELSYRPPFRNVGAVLTLVSCAILLFSVWRWPRLRLPG